MKTDQMYHPATISLLNSLLDQCDTTHDQRFQMRLSANFDTIHHLYRSLYGHQKDEPHHLQQLLNTMISAHAGRSGDFKKIDIQREEQPGWFLDQKWVGMMLYVDRFSGDLKQLARKLSYFDDLGINLVHLMPLMKCPQKNNDGGYAVSDFRQVNPQLGTIEDLRKVARAFTRKNKLLMLDLAVNHTSRDHEWAQKALNGDKEYQDYYYMYDTRNTPDQFEESMPEVFPEICPGNFTHLTNINKWVMTVFHDYQWDLNYTNPGVFIKMLDNLLFLSNLGVDIVRLDALAFMWKRIGTSCQNLDEAHRLIRLFKACAQVVAPGTLFLAEAIVAPNEIVKYFGDIHNGVTNECELAYNATLMTLLWESITTKNNRLLNVSLDQIPSKPFGTTWLNYVRCHDDIGLGYEDTHAAWAGYDAWSHRRFITEFLAGELDISFSKGARFMEDRENGNARISGSLASLAGLERAIDDDDKDGIEAAINRIILMHAVILSYGGIPLLYMGDELGMTNDYSYLKDPEKKFDNRWMHRPEMDWNKYELRKQEHTVEHRIYNGLRHLIEVRKGIAAFSDVTPLQRIDCRNQHVFAFRRHLNEEKIICVFNLNDHSEPLYRDIFEGFNVRGLKDLATGNYISLPHGNIMLSPYQFMWITET